MVLDPSLILAVAFRFFVLALARFQPFTGHDMLDKGRGCMDSGASCADVDRIAAKDSGKLRLLYAAAHCHAPATGYPTSTERARRRR